MCRGKEIHTSVQRERNTYRCAEGKKYIQICRGKEIHTDVQRERNTYRCAEGRTE
jgi:hypothetical protein